MLEMEKSEADRLRWLGHLHGWCQMEDKQYQNDKRGSWEVPATERLVTERSGPRERLELISEELKDEGVEGIIMGMLRSWEYVGSVEEPSAEDFWKCPSVGGRQRDLNEMF